jgi:pyridoxine 5'-phosphate synthase PdxJ
MAVYPTVSTFVNAKGDVIRFTQNEPDRWVVDYTGCYGMKFESPDYVNADTAYTRMDKLASTGWTEQL